MRRCTTASFPRCFGPYRALRATRPQETAIDIFVESAISLIINVGFLLDLAIRPSKIRHLNTAGADWREDGRGGYTRAVGALLTGVFADSALNGVSDGLLFGNPAQLGIQMAAVAAAIVYSGVGSFVLLKTIGVVIPLRATADDESTGLDVSQHGEEAYVQAGGTSAT